MSVTVSVTNQTVEVTKDGQTVTVSPITQSVTISSPGPQGATGSQGSAGATGPQGPAGSSGVAVVNAPLTNSGTSGSANISIGTAATAGVYGVTTLIDSTSSTSTTTAATPAAVKVAFDAAGSAVAANNYHAALGFTTTSIETIPRSFSTIGNVNFSASGRIFFSMFRPVKDLTVGTASIYCVTAGTGMTTARMGLYTWSDSTGTATLVARTANDTSIFGTAATLQSRAFDTAGGYPSTYTLVAGSAYAFGVVYVGTGAPFAGGISTVGNLALTSPRTFGLMGSQSDLPTATSNISASSNGIWGRFS